VEATDARSRRDACAARPSRLARGGCDTLASGAALAKLIRRCRGAVEVGSCGPEPDEGRGRAVERRPREGAGCDSPPLGFLSRRCERARAERAHLRLAGLRARRLDPRLQRGRLLLGRPARAPRRVARHRAPAGGGRAPAASPGRAAARLRAFGGRAARAGGAEAARRRARRGARGGARPGRGRSRHARRAAPLGPLRGVLCGRARALLAEAGRTRRLPDSQRSVGARALDARRRRCAAAALRAAPQPRRRGLRELRRWRDRLPRPAPIALRHAARRPGDAHHAARLSEHVLRAARRGSRRRLRALGDPGDALDPARPVRGFRGAGLCPSDAPARARRLDLGPRRCSRDPGVHRRGDRVTATSPSCASSRASACSCRCWRRS
jgi:hypothetical protein